MSTEEDLELRDLVTQALENNGVLGKIRAQLRASVFLALEEQELLQNKNAFTNKSFKDFVKTSEGALLTQLVREFLEYFGFDFTLSVFDPESNHGKDYEYCGRNMLVKNLAMKNVNDDKGPVLLQMFRLAQKQKQGLSSLPKEDGDQGSPTDNLVNNKTVYKRNIKNTSSVPGIVSETDEKHLSSSEAPENVPTASEKGARKGAAAGTAAQKSSPDEPRALSKLETSELKKTGEGLNNPLEEMSARSGGLTSLSNLPPLLNISKTKSESLGSSAHDKRDINKIKSMINALDVGDNNYDEDFLSSASGSGLEGKSAKNSGADSEEIEEDIGSGIEDLLSNASGMEDMTIDATISASSIVGDYVENI